MNRDNFENWIPFTLKLNVSNKIYEYSETSCATFSVYEIENLILNLKEIIKFKRNKMQINKYEFYCSEAYFEFIVYDPMEYDEVCIEIWINMGRVTDGEFVGYDEGVRFEATIDCLEDFVVELEKNFLMILEGFESNN